MATTSPQLMTADEFQAMPDDGWRYELIEGVPKRMPPAGIEHGGISGEYLRRLGNYVRPRGLGIVFPGDTGFVFAEHPPEVRAPDVTFIRTERLPPREEWKRFSRVLPDLAIEVVSPSDTEPEIAEKVAYYLDHGVPLVWVTYPSRRQVVAHRAGQPPRVFGVGDTLDGEDVIPGFTLPVAEVFV